jgi:type IV pilus assembly protein PilA
MMNVSTRKNQAGFSLVELMVVVAIIGILASLAIPSIGKYMAKARQSEAKTQLSSLYTAEKAFFAEYTAFDQRFGAVGYSPEGRLRYNVGFANGANGLALPANGYNVTLAGAQINTATLVYCNGATGANGCQVLNGATNAQPPAISGTAIVSNAAGASTFIAEASAVIHNSGATDTWRMNEIKNLDNTSVGIP